ncbi:MAG: hypothetical protein HOY76_23390 [Streptomyces sp.]|nr:hypothetical protein [Streptomyces sp.]
MPQEEPETVMAAAAGGMLAFPPPEESPRAVERPDFHAALTDRRSVRDFADQAPPVSDLARTLQEAAASQQHQWPVHRHGDPGLTTLVAAYHVDGLAPGLHAWETGSASFTALTTPGVVARLGEMYTPAPALVLLGGSIERVGGEAYGGLLVRAGALGYAVWLAARSRGLECSAFGLADHELSATFHQLSPGSAHLFTVALGYAREP